MSETKSVVLVGAGLAAASAAATLRDQGFDGRLVMIGAEPELPYDRPPLTKDYLAGERSRDELFVHPSSWYSANDVELALESTVIDVDLADQTVAVDVGGRIRFDKLILATGATPRRLDGPGSDTSDVYYLRNIADADRLRQALASGDRRVVIVGAGWIGLEAAAAARAGGHSVTVVDPQSVPLEAVLGPQLGAVFGELHRQHGIALQMGTGVHGFRTREGRLTAVQTHTGDIPADIAIVGVGVVPAVALAEAAGLRVDNGALVDAHMRTSHPDVYAIGDVANAYNPLLGQRLRVEHWENARTSGAVAARSILGQSAVHDVVPYFFTDQYDLGMEFSGHTAGFDQLVIRGSVAEREFVAFWLRSGRVIAGTNVNVWDVVPAIQSLIRAGRPVDVAALSDPSVALDELGTETVATR